MSLTFHIEPLVQCWNEVMVLAAQHWDETEGYRAQKFRPDLARYVAYESGGWFMCFTGRDGARLAAYAGIYIVPDMHTQELLATEDAFFMAKEYRGGRNFLRFYQHIEAEIAERGAKRIMFTAPQTNGTGRLLERLDYRPVSVQYSKLLARADSAPVQPAVMENADVRA